VTNDFGGGATKPPTGTTARLALENSDDFAGESRITVTEYLGDGVTILPTSTPAWTGMENSDDFVAKSGVAVTNDFGAGVTKPASGTDVRPGQFPECRLAFKSISRKRKLKIQDLEGIKWKLRVH
jgi:hypothetical protein